MSLSARLLSVLAGCCALAAVAVGAEDPFARAGRLSIVVDSDNDRIHRVLQDRILKRSAVTAEITHNEAQACDLRVYLGWLTKGDTRLSGLAGAHGVELPTIKKEGGLVPAAEGFAIKTVTVDGVPSVIAVANEGDTRGLVYAVGELLRRFTYGPDWVSIDGIDLRTAPAYRLRGSSANQGGTMRQVTGARAWTQDEWGNYMLDYVLAGANTAYAHNAEYDFVKQFGVMTVAGCRPNQFSGDIPPEWKAGGLEAWEGTDWVCPSVPEARKALLDQFEKEFPLSQDHDILRIYAGDPGGCRCERCAPWGKTFVELCAEVAAIWLKHHPESFVQIANQDLDNEGDRAIWAYLNAEPRPWLEGIAYGPGSNAMSPYFRDELREDLFEYPGSGPVNRYLREMLNNLPKEQVISHYSDITHWISAQYQVENPEPHIFKIYGRRTFHTRPEAFYRIFQAIMPFSEGDIIYSEGYHDEFHQYLWNRLLWNPNRSLQDVMDEYCRYHFGADAVEPMRESMFLLEKNLEAPMETYEGIDRVYALVKEAGERIPPHLMKDNYRWRLFMQKAALDKYFQMKLRRELEQERAVAGLAAAGAEDAVAKAQAVLKEAIETPEMAALREEAGRLGEESNNIIGLRNVGYFSVNKPLTSLGWVSKQIEAAAAANPDERQVILRRIGAYEDPGPGGFYDDAGAKGRQPHLLKGDSYDATYRMDPNNRHSQNTIAYSVDDPRGLVFRYTSLDPQAGYRVRLTIVQPRMPENIKEPVRRVQNILADDQYVARDVEVPTYSAQIFEYDIPQSATQDGSLDLTFERAEGSAGVTVSEVWLMRK